VALGIFGSVLSVQSVAHADPPLQPGQHFTVDPVIDGVLVASGVGFSALLGDVLGTGELRPVTPPSDASILLPFDRVAVTQTIDPKASMYSNIGLWVATGFAVADPVLSGLRDGWDALLIDALMYAESGALTSTMTDVVKIATRRPRPIDYKSPSTTDTNMELSFPSGHASGVASVAATATYLAFVRSPRSPRPWITLAAGTLLTAFVSYERVRAGAHFPTDVVAGSMLGGAIGVLVPHLHRHAEEPPPILVGVAPVAIGSGATLTLIGHF
jgi:membrane-associated phospholipid phosphatase